MPVATFTAKATPIYADTDERKKVVLVSGSSLYYSKSPSVNPVSYEQKLETAGSSITLEATTYFWSESTSKLYVDDVEEVGVAEGSVEEIIEEVLTKLVGTTLMAQDDERVEDLVDKALIVAPVSEDANQERPKIGGEEPGHVIWPNTLTPNKAAAVEDATPAFDFQFNKEGA